jgi:hypothetical protein
LVAAAEIDRHEFAIDREVVLSATTPRARDEGGKRYRRIIWSLLSVARRRCGVGVLVTSSHPTAMALGLLDTGIAV